MSGEELGKQLHFVIVIGVQNSCSSTLLHVIYAGVEGAV